MPRPNRLKITHIATDILIDNLNDPAWTAAPPVVVSTYWSGTPAPAGRHFIAALLWSESHLYVRFVANQTEPLVVSGNPDLSKKTIGLWDRDVCEIFVAPDRNERSRYFEFEIAPTGEWIDLGIHILPAERETDWDYSSEMTSSATIESQRVMMGFKIPWEAFSKRPKPGDVWSGNLFRCVGTGATRGFLAWRPTGTEKPNFHVPSAFGEFEFVVK